MRAFNQGAFFRVTVSADEVHEFARRWPCFGDISPLSFIFESGSGNLVDVAGCEGMDEGGVDALADDAKAYGAKRLKLNV